MFFPGVGAVFFVILTAAGTVSPPVLLGMKMYKKYKSNPWWTYSPKQIRSAVVRGAVAGTMFLPFLAPWGVYKLFRTVATKIKKARFWKRPVEYDEMFFQIIGENIVETPRNLKEKHIDNQGNSKETGSEIVTLKRTISLENNALENNACQVQTNETCFPTSLSGAASSKILRLFRNLNEDSIELARFHTFFNPSCIANREEESSEFKVPCDSGNFVYPLTRQPEDGRQTEDGREAFSDEENEYHGRRDIQQSWIRRAMSEGSCRGKISDETFRSVLDWREAKSNRLTRVLRRSDPKMYHQLLNWLEDSSCTEQGNAEEKRDARRGCAQIQVAMEPETCKGICNLSKECSIPSDKTHGVARAEGGLGGMQTNKPEQKQRHRSKTRTVIRFLKQRFGRPVQEQENGMTKSGEESISPPAAQRQVTRGIREVKTLLLPRQELEESLPATLTLVKDRKNRTLSKGMLKPYEPVNNRSVKKTNKGGSDLVWSDLQGKDVLKRKVTAPDIGAQREKQLSSKGPGPALVKPLKKQDRDGQNKKLYGTDVDMSEYSEKDIIERFDQID